VNQSSRFTACLPFLTEDVHGIPEVPSRSSSILLSGLIADP